VVGGVTVRHLDYYLIWMAGSSYTANVGERGATAADTII
jgi:hypothetical protein